MEERPASLFNTPKAATPRVAITAWSLVISKGGILLPENLHSPILQSGALVSSTRHAAAARRFLDFLTGPEGRKILQSNGLFRPSRRIQATSAASICKLLVPIHPIPLSIR